MIDMNVLVNQLIELFIIICLGFFMYKINILNDTVNKHVNALVIKVTMPCMMVSSVLSMDASAKPSVSTVTALFAVSIGFFALMPVLSYVIVKIMLKVMKIKKHRQGAYIFMLIFSNVGFMGIPVLRAATGDSANIAVFYAAVLNIFFNLSVFTYGVAIICYGDEANAKFKPKDLLSPGIISAVLALVIYLVDFHFPTQLGAVKNSITTVGELTPPLAMLLVGSTLSSMKFKEAFGEWRVYVFSVIKQILLPIALYPLYRFLIKDDLLFTVMFIELLMPVANISLILCTQYNLDKKFASKVIFITTLMSLATIPLVLYFCQAVFG